MAQRIPAAILILITTVILALPASARQKEVAPTLSLPAQAGSAPWSGGVPSAGRRSGLPAQAGIAATVVAPGLTGCGKTRLFLFSTSPAD